jgi:hypothetical protein
MFRVLRFRKACVAELYVVRQLGGIRVIRQGFQQQHGGLRVFSQAAGQHRARRARADDHHVICHGPSFTAWSAMQGLLRCHGCP